MEILNINNRTLYAVLTPKEQDYPKNNKEIRKLLIKYLIIEGLLPKKSKAYIPLTCRVFSNSIEIYLGVWELSIPARKINRFCGELFVYSMERDFIEKNVLPILKNWIAKESLLPSKLKPKETDERFIILGVLKSLIENGSFQPFFRRVNDKLYNETEADALVEKLNEMSVDFFYKKKSIKKWKQINSVIESTGSYRIKLSKRGVFCNKVDDI